MAELNVNIMDYLTEEQLQEVAIEEFRSAVRRFLCDKKTIENVLVNVSYDIVFKKVAEVTEKPETEIEKIITERVIKCIDAETIRYQMFRSGDSYFKEGCANPILRKIVAEFEGLMRETVEKNIKDYNFTNVRDAMLDMVYQVIEEKLFSKKEDKE